MRLALFGRGHARGGRRRLWTAARERWVGGWALQRLGRDDHVRYRGRSSDLHRKRGWSMGSTIPSAADAAASAAAVSGEASTGAGNACHRRGG